MTEDFSNFFNDPSTWQEDLVAIGGDFSSDRLFYAYSHGIFPWSENPIRWYSLDPRAIFDIDGLHVSRSLKKKIKKEIYQITFNKDFDSVIKACADRPGSSTWITEGFIEGYCEFHRSGYAHSVEAWSPSGELVGGVYGIAIGKFFAGESMFSRADDSGKIALFYLFENLKKDGFQLFDTQQLTETTWHLGAYEIPKQVYLVRLREAVKNPYKWVPGVGISGF